MSVSKYRLKSPTVALSIDDGRHVAKTIPEGAIVECETVILDGSNRLIEVLWEKKTVWMFPRDIHSSGEKCE